MNFIKQKPLYKIPLKYLNGVPIVKPRRDNFVARWCKPPSKPADNTNANPSSEQERDPTFPFLL